MQLIIPEKSVRIRTILLLDTLRLINRTVVLITPDTLAAGLDARPVEILGGIVVDVLDQRIRIEDGEMRAGIALRDEHLKRGPVLEDLVDGRSRLVHDLGDQRVVRPFLRPVLVVADAVQRVVGVQRGQMQGDGVHQDEVAAPRRVQRVEHRIHAPRVVGQHLPRNLRVRQERPDPQVVGPNPQRVDRRGRRQAAGWVQWCRGRAVDLCCGDVGQERRDLVLQNRREIGVDEFEVSGEGANKKIRRGTWGVGGSVLTLE